MKNYLLSYLKLPTEKKFEMGEYNFELPTENKIESEKYELN